MKIFNQKSTRDKRKLLRHNQTEVEEKIWEYFRNKCFKGYKFFRQYGVGPYIADFYCPEFMLAIELDGDRHFSEDGIEYDKERDAYFAALNVKTLRFSNTEFLRHPEQVLDSIDNEIQSLKASPSFVKRGNGGVRR